MYRAVFIRKIKIAKLHIANLSIVKSITPTSFRIFTLKNYDNEIDSCFRNIIMTIFLMIQKTSKKRGKLCVSFDTDCVTCTA